MHIYINWIASWIAQYLKFIVKLISQLCDELQLAACLSRGDGAIAIWRPQSTCGCLTSLRNKPQQNSLGNFQHQYLHHDQFLVNVCSYHLMVKNMSCYRVRDRQIRPTFINTLFPVSRRKFSKWGWEVIIININHFIILIKQCKTVLTLSVWSLYRLLSFFALSAHWKVNQVIWDICSECLNNKST